jgi:hypothetical protein
LREVEEHLRVGKFQRSLCLVAAGSGLLGGIEVTLEHYRGSYGQRIMYSPILFSGTLAATGVAAAISPRVARKGLPPASVALLLNGLLGFVFHIRGVARKPGGWRIPIFNIVMGPPLFAPLLLGIGGVLGLVASRLEPEESKNPPIPEARLQKVLSGVTAASALLNGFESLYSHYKSRFATKAQWIPIIMTPPLVAVGIAGMRSERAARTWLPAISAAGLLAGLVGFGYHLRGVLKRPGFRELPVYNFAYGPPVLAPLLFSATGFMGLLASQLNRDESVTSQRGKNAA